MKLTTEIKDIDDKLVQLIDNYLYSPTHVIWYNNKQYKTMWTDVVSYKKITRIIVIQ